MRTRIDALIDQHGPVLGPMLHDAERDAAAKARATFEQQQAELRTLDDAIAMKRGLAVKRLEPFEAGAASAYAAYLDACARVEQQRQEDNRAIVGLVAKRHEVVQAMNVSPFAARVKQWEKVSDMPQLASA